MTIAGYRVVTPSGAPAVHRLGRGHRGVRVSVPSRPALLERVDSRERLLRYVCVCADEILRECYRSGYVAWYGHKKSHGSSNKVLELIESGKENPSSDL